MKLWKNSGNFMIATGIIHNIIGFAMGWSVLADIARSGFINSVNEEMDRNAVFWFLFGGFMMMFAGQLMNHYIKEYNRPIPVSTGYYLLILTLSGCVMMPVSGFWLVVPQAMIIIFANKKAVAMAAESGQTHLKY